MPRVLDWDLITITNDIVITVTFATVYVRVGLACPDRRGIGDIRVIHSMRNVFIKFVEVYL